MRRRCRGRLGNSESACCWPVGPSRRLDAASPTTVVCVGGINTVGGWASPRRVPPSPCEIRPCPPGLYSRTCLARLASSSSHRSRTLEREELIGSANWSIGELGHANQTCLLGKQLTTSSSSISAEDLLFLLPRSSPRTSAPWLFPLFEGETFFLSREMCVPDVCSVFGAAGERGFFMASSVDEKA